MSAQGGETSVPNARRATLGFGLGSSESPNGAALMFVSADSIRATPFGVFRIHIRFPRVARRSFPSRRSTLGCHRAAPIGAILTRAHEGHLTSNDSELDFRLRVLAPKQARIFGARCESAAGGGGSVEVLATDGGRVRAAEL